jgi:hypothetical protein
LKRYRGPALVGRSLLSRFWASFIVGNIMGGSASFALPTLEDLELGSANPIFCKIPGSLDSCRRVATRTARSETARNANVYRITDNPHASYALIVRSRETTGICPRIACPPIRATPALSASGLTSRRHLALLHRLWRLWSSGGRMARVAVSSISRECPILK